MESKRLRRMAAEVDEEHRQAMRTIRGDLLAALPEPAADDDGRRGFLRGAGFSGLAVAVGGLTLGLDALLHAAAAQTGTTTPTTTATSVNQTTPAQSTTTSTLPPRQPNPADRALLGFLQSLELTVVAAYGLALDAKKLSDASTEVATIFQAHHRQHAQATGSLAGPAAPNKANTALLAVYGPKLQSAASEKDLLTVASQLETAAASAYAAALAKVTGTDPAGALASILPIESRHAIVLGQAAGLDLKTLAPTVEDTKSAATPEQYPIEGS